jgi:hypothetical protein
MPNEETVQQATRDRGPELNDFLDKVDERILARAKEESIFGLLRLGNVWRFNNADATITQGPSPSDLLVSFRCGADASKISQTKAGSVDSTADVIVDTLQKLTEP